MPISSTTALRPSAICLRVPLLGLLAEGLRGQRIDRIVEIAVDFHDEAAHERPRPHVAGKERRAGRGIRFVQVLDDRVRFVEDEIAVDEHGHAMPRIERQEFRLARIAGGKREHLSLIGERLVLERELHAPRVGGAGAVIEDEGHDVTSRWVTESAIADQDLRPAAGASP